MKRTLTAKDEIPVLPETIPVTIPELPARLRITTIEQFRACSDPLRAKILGIIQTQPATAKQIADRLDATPGAIGHHLHLLEEAGLAQVVARRLVRGVVAKYYTRTARLFDYDLPSELTGATTVALDMVRQVWSELADSSHETTPDAHQSVSSPHVRLAPDRVQRYRERLQSLVDDLLHEPIDANGVVYSFCLAMFLAPSYLQTAPSLVEQNE